MIKKVIMAGIFFVFATPSYGASSANVNVENNVSSNSNSSSQVSSHTNITVETDGNVTHYESDEGGKIEVKAENGKSEIKVNGVTVSGSPTKSNSPTGITQTPQPTNEDEVNEDEQKINENEFTERIIEQLKRPIEIIKKIFSFLPF
ncbi:MAG: hypothetical protein AAB520_02480 [Patescibacteria group bacterium]